MAARLRRTASASVKSLAMAALMVLPLMGCANYIFKTFDVDRGESLSIDARQRVVLVTHKGGKTRDRTVVCTEPSPDALTAQAASASASGAATLPQGSGSVRAEAASSEAAASIAMRTQTIQLLRDGLFRACEAYMNGAIDQHQYNVVLLNIDKLMITLMGVDAIGGTATAPAVAIAAGVPASPPQAKTDVAGRTGVGAAQAEAVANIVLAANAHSSLPGLCISLLASGELRLDNPGQQALLARCDYLLAGAVDSLVNRPPPPMPQYRMSVPTAPEAPQKKVAGWATRADQTAAESWTTTVIAASEPQPAARPTPPLPPPSPGRGWSTRITRYIAND